jgi:hypothetical protein
MTNRYNISAVDMTLRDWFAGQALTGIIARMSKSEFEFGANSEDWSFAAGDAFDIADQMIKQRGLGD